MTLDYEGRQDNVILEVKKGDIIRLGQYSIVGDEETEYWTDESGVVYYASGATTVTKSMILKGHWKAYQFEYKINEDATGYTLVALHQSQGAEVSIPSMYRNLPVIAIGADAFAKYGAAITKLTIPSSVTSIGSTAFLPLTAIENLTIPFVGLSAEEESGYLGEAFGIAMRQVQKDFLPKTLKSVTITNQETVPDYALSDVSTLEKLTFVETKTLGHYACSNLPLLRSVELGKVENIEMYAFSDDAALASITLPEGLKTIDEFAFRNTALTTLTFPASLESYVSYGDIPQLASYSVTQGNKSFTVVDGVLYNAGKTEIVSYPRAKEGTSFTLPESVTKIGTGAFAYTSLTSADLANVTDIGGYAFMHSALEGITISRKIIHIETNALQNAALTSVTFEESDSPLTIDTLAFSSLPKLTSIALPKRVTAVSDRMLAYNPVLTTITFSSSLKSVGKQAFNGDEVLTGLELTFQDAASIGDNAFHNCDALTTVKVHFDEGVTTYPTLGEQQYMPLIAVDDAETQTALKAAWASHADSIIVGIPDMFVVSSDGKTLTSYTGTKDAVVEIPSSVTTIAPNAFANHSEIKELIIPSSVKTFGYRCFSKLTSLAAVRFHGDDFSSISYLDANGNAVTSSQNLSSLFYDSQERILIADNDTALASLKKAYSSFTQLGYYTESQVKTSGDYYLSSDGTSVLSYAGDVATPALPSGVTSIAVSAFNGRKITSIDLSHVTTIGYEAFYGTKLTALTLPSNVTSIGDSSFAYCESLASVTIDDAAVTIGGSAFDSDTELSEFSFGSGAVRLEGGSIWASCDSLETLTVPNTLAYIQYDAFADFDGTVSCEFTQGYADEHYTTDDGVFYDGNTNNDVVWAEE